MLLANQFLAIYNAIKPYFIYIYVPISWIDIFFIHLIITNSIFNISVIDDII